MNVDADNSSLFLRFTTVLAANVQNGPDLGIFQKIGSATVPSLNEFLLDASPVTLVARAGQRHRGLIHFQSFFLAHVRTKPHVSPNCRIARGADEKSLCDGLSSPKRRSNDSFVPLRADGSRIHFWSPLSTRPDGSIRALISLFKWACSHLSISATE